MIILLEENKYTDITLASIASHCETGTQTVVTDNIDLFMDENEDLTEPVFFIRGESIKIVTGQFDKFIASELENLKYFSLAKQYPGAYFKKSFSKAYELCGIEDYATCFDTDVMLVNPVHYRQHRNSDIASLKHQEKVSLMHYNLNAKDDFLMTQIMDAYTLLGKNIWFHEKAGVINFSLDIIKADNVESCVLMPFDLLHQYTHGSGIDLEHQIAHKASVAEELFGKIKKAIMDTTASSNIVKGSLPKALENNHHHNLENYNGDLGNKDKKNNATITYKNIKLGNKDGNIDIAEVNVNGVELMYSIPNDMTKWRAETLCTKEPITFEWISNLKEGDVLYDIGANVGIYSIMAAKYCGAKVVAFEPESQNYAILNNNVIINNVNHLVHAYSIAISDQTKLTHLYMPSVGTGGDSCNSIDMQVNFKLKPMIPAYSQGCFMSTIDDLVASGLPAPTHIKVDVDGFEHKVIAGSKKTLRNVKSMIIEIDQNLQEHCEIIKYLLEVGFTFDPEQVKNAERKSGTFKGLAEYVFNRK